MATKGQKIGFTITSALLFGVGNVILKSAKAQKENRQYTWKEGLKDACWGLGIGGVTGRLTAELFGEPNDTVNYALYNKKNKIPLVYHGHTYEYRVNKRILEHKSNGKKFTNFKFDNPKPKTEAKKLEQMRIVRDQPIYNIQHNCN